MVSTRGLQWFKGVDGGLRVAWQLALEVAAFLKSTRAMRHLSVAAPVKRPMGPIAREYYGAFHKVPRHCFGKKGGCLVCLPARGDSVGSFAAS